MNVNSVSNVAANSSNANTAQKSKGLDQNSFLKILIAELTNQDPTSTTSDPTAYISQLAQFTSLEQMTNLNTTMTMSSANTMLGKSVTLSDTDSSGNNYTGVVQSVIKSGSNVSLNVLVMENEKLQPMQFSSNNVIKIAENSTTVTKASANSTTSTSV